jgi:hypothetical protein
MKSLIISINLAQTGVWAHPYLAPNEYEAKKNLERFYTSFHQVLAPDDKIHLRVFHVGMYDHADHTVEKFKTYRMIWNSNKFSFGSIGKKLFKRSDLDAIQPILNSLHHSLNKAIAENQAKYEFPFKPSIRLTDYDSRV